MTSRRAALVVVLVVVCASAGAYRPASAQPSDGRLPPARTITWASTGDSYASGEGSSGAVGYCQQSLSAFGAKAANILVTERGWTIDQAPSTACTSHRAVDFFNSPDDLTTAGTKPPPARPAGSTPDSATSLWEWGTTASGKERFDVVTLSFGGNDIGFSDVLIECLGILPDRVDVGLTWQGYIKASVPAGRCDTTDADIDKRLAQLDAIKPLGSPPSPAASSSGKIVDFYRTVADSMLTADGVLVVVGYPRLLSPSSTWGRWRGGRCNTIDASDADLLGDAATKLDDKLRSAVNIADAGRSKIVFVSRLDLFDDGGSSHSLCGKTVEWLNTIFSPLRDGTFRKERAFHPNDLGNLATAERVAGELDTRFGRAAPTTTTAGPTSTSTSPTVRSAEQHFDIGDEFEATCTIAWPTAPQRGTNSIQMRTTCPGVPTQFMFVDIAYQGDLDVTPSRPRVRVRGTVSDIVRSEYGFTVLQVIADDATVL